MTRFVSCSCHFAKKYLVFVIYVKIRYKLICFTCLRNRKHIHYLDFVWVFISLIAYILFLFYDLHGLKITLHTGNHTFPMFKES